MKKLLLSISFFLFVIIDLKAQNRKVDEVIHAIQAGNAETLALNFSPNIDLTLLEDDNLYSKTQATMVMKDFFNHYPPQKVSQRYSGSSKDGSFYAILDYHAQNKEHMRVIFYLKLYEHVLLMNELKFELAH